MDPPPPYQAIRKVTLPPTPTLPQVDLEGCIHRHELLVVVHQDANQLRPAALHYWNSRGAAIGSERLLLVPSTLSMESVQLIDGFQDRGTVEVTVEDAADWVTIHSYISSVVSGFDAQPLNIQTDAGLISAICGHLRSQAACQPSAPIQLASIPVFSNSPDRFAEGGPALAWKWVKPNINHPERAGFWEFEFDAAIPLSGAGNGDTFSLLVRGVPEDSKAKTELAGKRVMMGTFD